MKTKEELNALKNEVEILNKKLAELSEDELAQVAGGPEERTVLGLKPAADCKTCEYCGQLIDNNNFEFCPFCGKKLS